MLKKIVPCFLMIKNVNNCLCHSCWSNHNEREFLRNATTARKFLYSTISTNHYC